MSSDRYTPTNWTYKLKKADGSVLTLNQMDISSIGQLDEPSPPERNVQFSNRQIQLVEGEVGNLGNLEKSITKLEQPVIPVTKEITEPIPPEELTGK